MAKNTIVSIGWLGSMINYLNVSKEDAIKRYKTEHDIPEDEELSTEIHISEYQVDDQWYSYDGAWI